MRYSLVIVALSSVVSAIALTPRAFQCGFKQLVTFDESQGATPASSFVAKDIETRGIQFVAAGIATFPEGVNVGIEPKSEPSTLYYGLNSGVGTGGTPAMTVNYEDSPFSAISLESFYGGCTFTITNIPVVPTRCIFTFKASSNDGVTRAGQQSFVFNSSPGTQQYLLKREFTNFTAPAYESVTFETDFEAHTATGWVKLSDLKSAIPGGPAPKVGATAFLDNIQMTATPKECATSAA